MPWCSCFKKTKVRPFDMDAKVETIVKDINGKAYWIYLEKIEYEKKYKEYIKYYRFYDPVKIQKIDKFAVENH